MPSPTEVAAAWPRKPSQTSDEDGKPAASHAALARNTAGVQLPQHPIPEIDGVDPELLEALRRATATTSRSSLPCVLPNSLPAHPA